MNRKRLKTIIKATAVLIAISAGSIFGGIIDAEATTKNLEQELISVVNEYGNDDVVIEDGISLRRGEKLDLSKHEGWKLSNENTLALENGVATPKNAGTVFLSNKIGDKVHIVEVYVPSNNAVYVQANSRKVSRDHYKVFIDPGHGGYDNGADGNGLYEDNLTLQISQKVRKLLVDRGIEVKMSRESDVFVGLGERAEMANNYGADLFVSPHINSFTSANANGIETYYHRDKGAHKPLSDNIQNNAIKETGAYNRGVKNANFAVLRESNMPSSLFEAGFISNPQEAAKMASDDYQNKLAKALADGIEKYLKDNIELEGGTVTPPVEPPVNPTPPPTVEVKTGTVTASSLNVRSGAGTGHKVIGSLKNGAKVEILSTSGGWHKIKYGSGHGYVSDDYVKITSTGGGSTNPTPPPVNPTPPPTVEVKTGTVTASSLNVRSGAGTGHKVIGSLRNGAKVEILSTSGGWHKIKYGSSHGYVSDDYVKITSTGGGSTNPTPPPVNPTPPPVSGDKSGTVTASSLNVRSGAGTGHKVIGSLRNGAKVEILSTSGGWHKIKYGSGYGYVSDDYVRVTSGGGSVTPPPVTGERTGTVKASSLNVRSGAGTGHKVIGSLGNGAKVTIVSTSGGWHKIKYGNGYGFVSADYIR
ncbi:MAG: SH3 domain-containing protein [Clostridium sp.]|uniref:SH3 domain-containing protein n=1 Tax=Clostridium sp. TaxID=1506 RepID=UPI003F385948